MERQRGELHGDGPRGDPGRTEAMTIRRGLWSRSPSGVSPKAVSAEIQGCGEGGHHQHLAGHLVQVMTPGMEMETATVTVTRKPQRDDGGGRLSDRENATGSGATGSSDPMPRRRVDLQRPLTRDQAGDLWRWLLGIDRYNWPRGNEVLGGGFAFFPVETQEAVQTHFRRMSEVNRIVMTVAFTECLRYIMAEVANLMHMGTLLGRRDAGEMVEVELDPEDGDPEQAEDAEDTTGLMQRFMEPKEQTSPASAAARWTANLGRLQKELIGQSEGVRAANIRRIRQALAACEPWSKPEECREQLRALLVTMWDGMESRLHMARSQRMKRGWEHGPTSLSSTCGARSSTSMCFRQAAQTSLKSTRSQWSQRLQLWGPFRSYTEMERWTRPWVEP